MTPEDFASELNHIVEEAVTDGMPRREFRARVKATVRVARVGGLSESQIRTQLAAKADAMQTALDAGVAE